MKVFGNIWAETKTHTINISFIFIFILDPVIIVVNQAGGEYLQEWEIFLCLINNLKLGLVVPLRMPASHLLTDWLSELSDDLPPPRPPPSPPPSTNTRALEWVHRLINLESHHKAQLTRSSAEYRVCQSYRNRGSVRITNLEDKFLQNRSKRGKFISRVKLQ